MSKALDKAYSTIKTALLDGQFAPGERLVETKLVDLSGTSRTPVREAIKQLVAENYLIMKPNSGVSVAQWSDRDLEDIFKLRATTESMMARRAAEQITPDQIAVLKEHADAIDHMLTADGPNDIALFLRENAAFHAVIRASADSPILAQTLARLVSPPIVYQVAHSFTARELERSNSHHREIIDALSAGDGDWAYHCMQSHIMSAFNRMRALRSQANN